MLEAIILETELGVTSSAIKTTFGTNNEQKVVSIASRS